MKSFVGTVTSHFELVSSLIMLVSSNFGVFTFFEGEFWDFFLNNCGLVSSTFVLASISLRLVLSLLGLVSHNSELVPNTD